MSGVREIAIHITVKGLERTKLCSHENIMILETQCLCLGIELHSLSHVLGSYIVFAPMEKNHGIDEESQYEIDQHTANHNQQALPCRLAAEFERLLRLFHLFSIETLVYHTRNLTISSERQPSQTVSGIRILWLELEEMEPRVEEQIELLYSYAEEFGEEEVSALMEQHQDGKRQHQLQRFDQKYFHLFTLNFELGTWNFMMSPISCVHFNY